ALNISPRALALDMPIRQSPLFHPNKPSVRQEE
ncbi:uncharacterized protein LOC112091191, partial [Morus notabilis]